MGGRRRADGRARAADFGEACVAGRQAGWRSPERPSGPIAGGREQTSLIVDGMIGQAAEEPNREPNHGLITATCRASCSCFLGRPVLRVA